MKIITNSVNIRCRDENTVNRGQSKIWRTSSEIKAGIDAALYINIHSYMNCYLNIYSNKYELARCMIILNQKINGNESR